MTKIESNNSKNKKHIAAAIELIFDEKKSLPEYLKKMLLDRLLWATTEHYDDEKKYKYEGQPYWSIGALKLYLVNRSENKFYHQNLRHEHAVPKIIIREQILALPEKSSDKVFEILNNFGHAVIVSLEEDMILNKIGLRSKMPSNIELNSEINNVFARYKKANIKVCDIRNINIKDLTARDLMELEKNSLI